MTLASSARSGFAAGSAPLAGRSLAVRPTAHRPSPPTGSRMTPVVAGVGDFFKDMMNFEEWAPKSARRWRLRQPPTEAELKAAGAWTGDDDDEDSVDMMSSLDARVQQMGNIQAPEVGDEDAATRVSFEDVSDTEFSSALNAKISTMTSSSMDAPAATPSAPEEDGFVLDLDKEGILTGRELRAAIYAKYGKTYDVSFVRRDMPGKTIVALNIMWIHMEQRSFPLSEEEYMDKLDGVCYIVHALGQTETVKRFMKLPPKPHMGLPARPIVGTAISIQFPDLKQDVIDEWFAPS